VPDLDESPGNGRPAHLATPEWQSFEVRMRARKAERCLQRAAEALDTGSIGEASDALDEARQLSPLHPRLTEFAARLEELKHPAPIARRHSYVWTRAAIVAGVLAFSAAGWQTWVHRDQLALLVPKALPNTDTSGMASPTPGSVPAADVSAAGIGAAASNESNAAPTSAPGDPNAKAASNDTTVQTILVRPDQVIDLRLAPASPEATAVATTGSGTGSDTKMDAQKAVMTASASELSAQPQRDIVPATPPPPEYRAPAVLPASPAPSPAAFIPSVVPPTESARSSTTTSAPSTNPSSDVGATTSAGVAPSARPNTSAPAPSRLVGDDRLAIRTALNRYESAYNRLDVDAVRTIWPSLDQRALTRAFDNLTSQRVALQNCNVEVAGNTARANCSGNAAWTPKVGGGERKSARNWTFDLSELDGSWRIVHVQAR
jgi:hypothetical protein